MITKVRYFIVFFLIWYFLNGLALTFVFKKSEIWDENNPEFLKRMEEEKNKDCMDMCPSGYFPPEVSNFGFFVHPDTYKYTLTWPVWLVDEIIYGLKYMIQGMVLIPENYLVDVLSFYFQTSIPQQRGFIDK